MPGLFVTTKSQSRRAVFAIEKKPPTIFRPAGTQTACVLGQFPWGPSQELTEGTSPKMILNTLAPPGMDHSGSAYHSITKKGFPRLFFVRVMGAGAVKAYADLVDSPTTIVRVTLKYPGTEGNNVTATVTDASNGDANFFNLEVSVTGDSGTTTDTIENINVSGIGDDEINGNDFADQDFDDAILVGEISKTNAGRPDNVSGVAFANGTTPAVGSADYIGTPGLDDKGLALLEGNKNIRHVFVDDCGDALRAAVNAGIQAHCVLKGEREGYITGDSGQTLAEAQTDKANYTSDRVVYCDPWVYQEDDDGNQVLIPGASYAASVASQYPTSTPISWKDAEVIEKLAGIVALESDRGEGAGSNTEAGLATFISEENGGFSIEADVTCAAAVDPTKANLTRRRITDHIALTARTNLRSYVDAPNLALYQQSILDAITLFMDGLKNAASARDPAHTDHIIDWAMGDLTSENTSEELALGHFTVPIDVRDSVGMHQIFLSINSGEGVVVVQR